MHAKKQKHMHHHNTERKRTIIAKLQKLFQPYSPLLIMFQLLNLICAYGDVFYGLTRTLMSKTVNDYVSKDSPDEKRI